MKFGLIDRIAEFTPGEHIVGIKAVSLAEEYLADHFPTFPVLPGVLMLEAMAEAGAWLVREAHDFAPSAILLREAGNVTYKSFVKPGNLLKLDVRCHRLEKTESDFVGFGQCDGREVVKAKFGLRHFNIEQAEGAAGSTVQEEVAEARSSFERLRY